MNDFFCDDSRKTAAAAVPLLLNWFDRTRRELPWREAPTPYRVWISEIMLQQTRIEAVKPYYARFMQELPDVRSLAAVEDDRLMKLWEGLGYYSRVRNLKKAAIQICNTYGGELPADAAKLKELAGIGDYTAGAIASLAFGLPEPAVDGNVLRVVSRLLSLAEDVMQPATKKAVTGLLRSVYPSGTEAAALTSALMELGEVLCVPNGTPQCAACPLQSLCTAHLAGKETDYPFRSPKKKRRIEHWTVLLLRNAAGQYALEKRPSTGLLASLWGFPMLPSPVTVETVRVRLMNRGLFPLSLASCGEAHHIFTHVEWKMTGLLVECSGAGDSSLHWCTPSKIRADYAVPTAFQAYLKKLP